MLRKSLRAARGKGSSVVITGPAGIGRSRLLAATVLEAKLSGFTVLHAADAEARAVPFGAIRSMVRALEEVEPEAASALSSSTQADGFAETGEARSRDESAQTVARAIREVSERRSLAIAVDDLHLVDRESLATLALLATDTEGLRLLLVATLDTDEPKPNDPGLSLLLASAAELALGPLSGEETRSLLSSLFGEVPNLDTVSALARANTQGNVRELMDAAQGLVYFAVRGGVAGRRSRSSTRGCSRHARPRERLQRLEGLREHLRRLAGRSRRRNGSGEPPRHRARRARTAVRARSGVWMREGFGAHRRARGRDARSRGELSSQVLPRARDDGGIGSRT